MAGKQTVELANTAAAQLAQLLRRQGIRNMGRHEFNCSFEYRVVDVETLAGAAQLRLIGRSQTRMYEPFADIAREGRTMVFRNKSPHHVNGGNAARASVAIAIDDVERTLDQEIAGIFTKRIDVGPVNGKTSARHQTGFSKDRRAAGNASELDTPLVERAQVAHKCRIFIEHGISARDDEDQIQLLRQSPRNGRGIETSA